MFTSFQYRFFSTSRANYDAESESPGRKGGGEALIQAEQKHQSDARRRTGRRGGMCTRVMIRGRVGSERGPIDKLLTNDERKASDYEVVARVTRNKGTKRSEDGGRRRGSALKRRESLVTWETTPTTTNTEGGERNQAP